MTENELKAIVIRVARNNGWRVYQTAQIKARRPVKSDTGYPDLTLAREGKSHYAEGFVFTPGDMSRVMWIELKQEKGVLSQEQGTWQGLLGTHVIRPSDVTSGYLLELLK